MQNEQNVMVKYFPTIMQNEQNVKAKVRFQSLAE